MGLHLAGGLNSLKVVPISGLAECPESYLNSYAGKTGCIIPLELVHAECAHSYGMLGLDFKGAPLSVRGRASLSGDRLRGLLESLKLQGVSECVALSTCNRTEIYFFDGDPRVVEFALCEACDVCFKDLRPYLTSSSGMCVACHMFRVTSGLESAVLGETEIVAQIKESWRIAHEAGTAGPYLDLMLRRALEAGKRVRTETELCKTVTSTGTLAVREAARLAGDLANLNVVLIGAGKIAERIAKELHGVGATQVTVMNRTVANAEPIAHRVKGRVAGLDALPQALEKADVILAAATVSEPLLTRTVLAQAMQSRSYRKLTIIDMGVPANVESGLELEGLALIDIDELAALSSDNERRRLASVPAAMHVMSEELAKFKATILKRSAGPTIASLLSKAEAIRSTSIAQEIEANPELTGEQIRFLDAATKRLVKRLLEAPLEELNGDMAVEGHRKLVERLFHLGGTDEPGQ